jgi:hypothetical protein
MDAATTSATEGALGGMMGGLQASNNRVDTWIETMAMNTFPST